MITANKQLFKNFTKELVIWLTVFTIAFVPLTMAIEKLGNTRVFQGNENLMDEMDKIVDEDNPFFQAFGDMQRVNVLLLGINQGLSDTIMLGSYDIKNNHVDVISIPRDTYYDRKEATTAATYKINAIYIKGTAVGTAKAVSDILMGMPIHYYAVVDYKGIGKIVDSVGGVPMDIPFHMHYVDRTDKPPLYIDIPKGPTVLNSANVVQFLRFRQGSPGYPGYPNGDIGRIEAQQKFIKSAFRESIGIGLPKVVRTTLRNVDSDLTLAMAVKLAGKAIGLKSEDLETWLLPGRAGMKNQASYWWPNEKEIETMLEEILSGSGDSENTENQEEQTQ